MQLSDEILLRRFAADRNESAFSEFVRRYLGLVLQVALRRTGSRQLAEEASQNVFCAVAKKADGIARHPDRIAAWLHRATLFESSKVMRAEKSFQKRKKLSHPDEVAETGESGETAWLMALPHLDQALDHLSSSDRSVVLQHYFEGKSFQEIGRGQARPAGTVQKQCRRALDKLARSLRGRGVTISALALAAGLSPQLAKASSPQLASVVAAKAVAGGGAYSSTHLTLYMLMKSKYLTPIVILAVLTPLTVQQAAILQSAGQNRELRARLSSPAGSSVKPMRASGPAAVVVSQSSGRVTIEKLARARAEAERVGGIRWLDYEDMVASLTEEELAQLIPQALDFSDRRKRINLSQALINALTEKDPEKTVRLVSGHDSEHPVVGNLGVERALYLWARKDERAAVTWLEGIRDQLAAKDAETARERYDTWSGFTGFTVYQEPVLSFLIESRSPLVRSVMTMAPETQFPYLLRSAIERPNPAGWHTPDTPASAREAAERVEAFLPWIREFASEESSTSGGPDQAELLERLYREESRGDDRGRLFSEQLLEGGALLPREEASIIGLYTANLLRTHFNSDQGPGWAVLQNEAQEWLQDYAPDEAEKFFSEAQEVVFKGARFQAESTLETMERSSQTRDSDLVRQIDGKQWEFFPDLADRVIEQAQRVKDSEEREALVKRLEAKLNSLQIK